MKSEVPAPTTLLKISLKGYQKISIYLSYGKPVYKSNNPKEMEARTMKRT